MPDPSAFWSEFFLYVRRTMEYRFECFEADGETELVVQSADVFRFKLWDTNDETPDLEADSVGPASATFTADAGTDTITSSAHGRQNGDKLHVASSSALPAPLAVSTTYFVIGATTNTFQLSLTSGGAAINLTDAGTGTHTWFKNSHITVNSLGVANTTPATVTVRVGQLDMATVAEGDYEGELTLVDDSDNDYIKPISRGPIRVEGTAGGEVGLT